jgi:hypothetical protein
MKTSPLAGKPAPLEILVNVPKLVAAYYTGAPDPAVPDQRVAFGTSGHRGSSFNLAFNEWHILAITQAICLYRKSKNIVGPLYLGIDTHALSVPACATALEVLAANGVEVMLAEGDEYTPTPGISHAILNYNRDRKDGLGIGGWRLLAALGIKPDVCHLNEGHAAFAVLERARSFMQQIKQPFEVALAATRAGNLFTTHTAVAAGFDRYPPALIEQYLGQHQEK